MNQLININEETETVSARDLHEALEIRERFSLWINRYKELLSDYELTSVGRPTEVQNNGGIQVKELEEEMEGLKEQLDAYKSRNDSLTRQLEEAAIREETVKEEAEKNKKPVSEEKPAALPDNFLADIDTKIDKKMTDMTTAILSAIATSTDNKDLKKELKEYKAKAERVPELEKRIEEISAGNLPEIKEAWSKIKEELYGTPTVALPSGIVEALDRQTGEMVKKKDEITSVPYFPGRPHASEANRPPFFVMPENMTRDGIEKENVKRTADVFNSMTDLHRKARAAGSTEQGEKIMRAGQETLVEEILNDNNLNDVQKISKYSVVRLLDGEYFHLLLAAVNNGLKAESVIAFLEEPSELFNMEIVRNYVSLAMNDKNSDMRCELARDLIDRRWSVRDGKDEYVLYSKDQIDALKDLLDKAAKGEVKRKEEPVGYDDDNSGDDDIENGSGDDDDEPTFAENDDIPYENEEDSGDDNNEEIPEDDDDDNFS